MPVMSAIVKTMLPMANGCKKSLIGVFISSRPLWLFSSSGFASEIQVGSISRSELGSGVLSSLQPVFQGDRVIVRRSGYFSLIQARIAQVVRWCSDFPLRPASSVYWCRVQIERSGCGDERLFYSSWTVTQPLRVGNHPIWH